MTVTRWNDHAGRTRGEVSLLLVGLEQAAWAEIDRLRTPVPVQPRSRTLVATPA